MKKQLKDKAINIAGYKFYKFEDILKEELKSESFRQAYNEELARLDITKQIKTLRAKKKLTQKELAKKANMPQSVIARLESGEHSISLGTLSRIAHAVGKKIQLV